MRDANIPESILHVHMISMQILVFMFCFLRVPFTSFTRVFFMHIQILVDIVLVLLVYPTISAFFV